MRGMKGKLICIWSPVLHGEGCSTLACAAGFAMQYYSGKKVLIVNKSNSSSHMEKYVEKDIEIKYSMDNLKIFNTGIRSDHILTYATQVNKGLYMIAGSRFNKELIKEDKDFDMIFLDRCLEAFDIVIADLDTGIRAENKLYLDRSDSILAVFTPNEIVMDELYQCPAMKTALACFTGEKAISIINKLYEGWEAASIVERYKNRYSIAEAFGLNYDGEVLSSCCTDRNFYSFLMKEMKREKNGYVKQLADICEYLADSLRLERITAGSRRNNRFFKRFLQSSIF